MKYKTHFTIVITCAVLSLFFTSCAIQKRHYRNGYYIQRSNTNNSKLEQQICSIEEREDSRATDGTAKTTSADSASPDVQITTIETLTAARSLTVAPDNSPLQEFIPIENHTYFDESVCNSKVKKTSNEAIQGKVPGKQEKKPWLTIAVWSLILALVFIPITISSPFGAVGWLICGMVLLVNALIFSIISINHYKRTRKTDRFDWHKAVATVIAFVSGIGLIVYGFWIWIAIAFAGLY